MQQIGVARKTEVPGYARIANVVRGAVQAGQYG
jgi:hypothetical protein